MNFFEYIKNFNDYKLFSTAHILYFVFAVVLSVTLAIVLRKCGKKAQRIIAIVVASLVLFLHCATQVWRVASFADGRSKGIIDQVAYLVMPNEILPFQLCSMLCLLIPISVALDKQWMHNALAPICVFAGFLFFFLPDGIINRYAPFSFRVMESMIIHTAILFYGLYLFTSKKVVFKMSNMKQVFSVLGGMFGFAAIMNMLLSQFDSNVDFFYMVKGFGLGLPPVVNELLIAIVGVALVFTIYGVCNLCYEISNAHSEKTSEKQEQK